MYVICLKMEKQKSGTRRNREFLSKFEVYDIVNLMHKSFCQIIWKGSALDKCLIAPRRYDMDLFDIWAIGTFSLEKCHQFISSLNN